MARPNPKSTEPRVSGAPSTEPRLSEAQFLAAQQAEAEQALSRALGDLKSSAAQAADIRLWTKEHPWASLGVAAVAGFAAAAALVPRKNESLGERAAKVASAFRGKTDQPEFESATLSGRLMGQLFDLAKVAAGNAIMAFAQSRMAPYSDAPPSSDPADSRQEEFAESTCDADSPDVA